LLWKHPVWSKCHFLVTPSSPSQFDEKTSSSNSCVTSDLSIFLEPLVLSSGWKSTATEQPLLEKPARMVRKCHWFPTKCCLFSPCPQVVTSQWAQCEGDHRVVETAERRVGGLWWDDEQGWSRTEQGCRVGWCRRELWSAQQWGCHKKQWVRADQS